MRDSESTQNMELPPSCYRISVKALVWDKTRTKFLLLQGDSGYWDLPGGGLVWEETPAECIRREVYEEMCIEVASINLETPFCFFTVTNPTVKYAYIVYETVLVNLDFTPSDECRAIKFVSPDEVRTMTVRPNVTLFLDYLR